MKTSGFTTDRSGVDVFHFIALSEHSSSHMVAGGDLTLVAALKPLPESLHQV